MILLKLFLKYNNRVLSGPETPLDGKKVGLSKSNWFLRVHCILSNEKITCSQKAVQVSVSIADGRVKSASMSSVEIMVGFHLIKS